DVQDDPAHVGVVAEVGAHRLDPAPLAADAVAEARDAGRRLRGRPGARGLQLVHLALDAGAVARVQHAPQLRLGVDGLVDAQPRDRGRDVADAARAVEDDRDVGGVLDERHEAPFAALQRLLGGARDRGVAAQQQGRSPVEAPGQHLDRHEAAVAALELHLEAQGLVGVLHRQQRQQRRAHRHELGERQAQQLAASGPQGQLGARVAVDDGVVAAEHEDRLAGVLQQLLEQPHRAVRGADRLGLLLGCQPARAHRQASAGPGARSAPVPRAHGTAVATKAVTGPGYGGAGRAAAEIATTQASAPRGRPARGQAAAARAPRARPYPRCAAPTTRPARASMRGGLRASPPVAWAAGPASVPGRWRAVELGLDRVEARRDELRDVQDLGRAMRLGALARAEHDLAERAAGGDDLGPRRDGLGEALLGDTPLAGLLLLPELRAAGAAAEGGVAAPLPLDQVLAAPGGDLGPRRDGLGEALLGDTPLAGLLLLPELRAAGAAAEGVVAALLHLDQVRAAAGEDRARRVVLAVVPAEVAGVVERHLPRLGQ